MDGRGLDECLASACPGCRVVVIAAEYSRMREVFVLIELARVASMAGDSIIATPYSLPSTDATSRSSGHFRSQKTPRPRSAASPVAPRDTTLAPHANNIIRERRTLHAGRVQAVWTSPCNTIREAICVQPYYEKCCKSTPLGTFAPNDDQHTNTHTHTQI